MEYTASKAHERAAAGGPKLSSEASQIYRAHEGPNAQPRTRFWHASCWRPNWHAACFESELA